MLGSIYIGLSGMNAYSKGLQTISNNVANLNSPGFKSTAVTFTDLFAQGGGGLTFSSGSDSGRGGGGVRLADPQIDFKEGDLRQSGSDLDLAIKGSGFLVLIDGDETYYARTGSFAVDDDGFISQQGTGYHLGILKPNGEVTALNVDGKRLSPPVKTTAIKFEGNLSNGDNSPDAGVTVTDIAVFDSRGAKQVWKVEFKKTAETTDEWDVTVTNQAGTAVGSGLKLKFKGSEEVDPGTSKLTVKSGPEGPDQLSVVLDFSSGVTSFSSGSLHQMKVESVDGSGVGTAPVVSIEDDGQVKVTYSNKKEEMLGAVALADFRNPQELHRIGNGLFENRGGGELRLLPSEAEGIGKLMSGQIEASNVDLSQQFGDLILIQRGFQASSQVVSVSNDMIQQLFGIRGQG